MVGKNINESLLQSAAVQAGVPVVCKKVGPDQLGTVGQAVADAVVLLGGMQDLPNLQAFTSSVIRVLKPGGRCVYARLHACKSCERPHGPFLQD
jgi:hypothetical protein